MLSTEIRSKFFITLKPICVNLLKNPSISGIHGLKSVIENNYFPADCFQDAEEYIIFPIITILKLTERNEDLFIEALKCLKAYILKSEGVKSVSIFLDSFHHLFSLLSSPENGNEIIISGSEEFKLTVVCCIKALLRNPNESLINAITDEKFLPPLGHAIFVLLQIAEKEKYQDLRIEALETIESLFMSDEKTECKFGSIFAFFLPGISISATNILTSDSKLGHRVIEKCLNVWKKLLILVLDAKYIGEKEEPCSSNKTETIYSNIKALKLVRRDGKWCKETGDKLAILVQKVCSCLVNHPNYRVRTSLLSWSKSLLLNCLKVLEPSIINLLEIALVLSNDDYKQVSKAANQILSEMSDKLKSEKNRTLIEFMEDQLYDQSTRLPRILRTGSDEQKLYSLQLFSGYIKLLGSRLTSFFNSSTHLDRFIKCLIQSLVLDISDVYILAKRPINHGYSPVNTLDMCKWKKEFKYFTNERIIKEMKLICCNLVCHVDSATLVEQILEYIHIPSYCNQCILLMNWLASGMNYEKSVDAAILIQLVEEYTCSDLWINNYSSNENLNVTNYRHENNSRSLDHRKNLYIQQVLLLEGIAIIAKVMGREFRTRLISCLYLVMVRVGSESLIVSAAGFSCLTDISNYCCYPSISDLICENSDYLLNCISKTLRRSHKCYEVPQILTVVLQNSNENIIDILKDIFDEILFLLDHNHDQAYILMDCLFVLVSTISQWKQPPEEVGNPSSIPSANFVKLPSEIRKMDQISKNISDDIADYHKKFQNVEDLMEDDFYPQELNENNFQSPTCEEELPPKEVHKSPVHVKLTVEILNRCSHFLSSNDNKLKLVVMDIIMKSVVILSNFQDELLPMIHKLWPSYIERFNEKKLFIVSKAFECLIVLYEVCADFIKNRVLKSILKNLLTFLKSQSSISTESKFSNYKFTQEFKLQMILLKNLGTLVSKHMLKEEEFSWVCESCMTYLNSQQPDCLQQEAFKLFISLKKYDEDAVWLYLNKKFPSFDYVSSDLSLPDVRFKKSIDLKFQKNVHSLLDLYS